jgi:hypothetical protein
VNGGNTWTGGDQNWNSTVCPTGTFPANRTSTVMIVAGSIYIANWNGYHRALGLAFYNNSLSLPSGLTYVDDLDDLSDNTNIWNQ